MKGGERVACNLELDRDSNAIINTNNVAAVSAKNPSGSAAYLNNGAHIGIYVPGEEKNTGSNYYKHGIGTKPFGTFANDTGKRNLYGFFNDRNGLKGGWQQGSKQIYWIRIFSIEVSKEVQVSRNIPAADIAEAEAFEFQVTLSGVNEDGTIHARNVEGEYGEMTFYSNGEISQARRGRDPIALRSGESITAENLPKGQSFRYEVVEDLTDAQRKGYVTVPGSALTGYMGENYEKDGLALTEWYISRARFINILPVCKLTDASGRLLYRIYTDSYGREYRIPAVYTELSDAVNALSRALTGESDADRLYQGPGASAATFNVAANPAQIQMLVPTYILNESLTLPAGVRAMLTTASRGDGSTAMIRRGPTGGDGSAFTGSMLTVGGALTLTNVTLDGSRATCAARADGTLLNRLDPETAKPE